MVGDNDTYTAERTEREALRARNSSPEAPDWGLKIGLNNLWTEVLEGLWVGGTADDDTVGDAREYVPTTTRRGFVLGSANIGPDDFDAVVTLYAWAQPVDWHVEELRTGIYDSDNLTDSEMEQVLEAAAWAARKWRAGKKVLIRCQAGLNRAPLVTAVLLMVEENFSAHEAVQHLRRLRSDHVLFNKGFVRALERLEWKLTYGED